TLTASKPHRTSTLTSHHSSHSPSVLQIPASCLMSSPFLVSRRLQLPCEFGLPSRSLPHDPTSSPLKESLRWDSQSGDSTPHTWALNRGSARILRLHRQYFPKPRSPGRQPAPRMHRTKYRRTNLMRRLRCNLPDSC